MTDDTLEILIIGITFYLMLIVGLELKIPFFSRQPRQLISLCGGILVQLILLPVLTLFLIQLTSPPLELCVGMLLVSLCPGGSVSNYYTLLARGDVAYSVTLTVATTLCCFISLPLFFNFFSTYFIPASTPIQLPFWDTIRQLLGLMIMPILLGMLIRKFFFNTSLNLLRLIKLTGTLGLFFVVTAIFITKSNYLSNYFEIIAKTALLFTLIALGCGLFSGYLLKLNKSQILALGIEFPARNLSIAASISLNLPNPNDAVLFAAVMFVTQLPVFIIVILSSLSFYKYRIQGQ